MSTDAAYHDFVPSFGHLGCYPDETHGMGFGLWRHVDKKLSPMTKSNDCRKRGEHICGSPGMHQGLGHIYFTRYGSATLQASLLAPGGAKCLGTSHCIEGLALTAAAGDKERWWLPEKEIRLTRKGYGISADGAWRSFPQLSQRGSASCTKLLTIRLSILPCNISVPLQQA